MHCGSFEVCGCEPEMIDCVDVYVRAVTTANMGPVGTHVYLLGPYSLLSQLGRTYWAS